MSEYLAHSARNGLPAQSYQDHIERVIQRAVASAQETEAYHTPHSNRLASVVKTAAAYHDLGKLMEENQTELHKEYAGKPLPFNHVDPGTAFLLERDAYAAFVAYAHHIGLPDFSAEAVRGENAFRTEVIADRKRTDTEMQRLAAIHHTIFQSECPNKNPPDGDCSVFFRMALSCLADADHTDSASAAGSFVSDMNPPKLRPTERLAALEEYVTCLKSSGDDRTILRQAMYQECRDSSVSYGIVSCSSPVGSGKTTAVMAHLLHQAEIKNARRIFVVLPCTNIISQSVEVYRKALTLPGENSEAVVAELHHLADYDSPDTRYLTALWRAPVVVTTAVAFFETLASNRPSTLRRLHELPGSVIFVDEAHAAMPAKLLPVAWHWMQTYTGEWGCHWVLASGSLVRFWDIRGIGDGRREVSDLVSEQLRDCLMQYESKRIRYEYIPKPLSAAELANRVLHEPGPRLLIMNTVRGAASMAKVLQKLMGRTAVEHISTALTPADRAETVKRVQERLHDSQDTEWVLVATSCVEAGVNFSFRTGFREIASLLSLLQSAGRVCREGEWNDATIFSFRTQDADFSRNPAVENSASILKGYFESNKVISPELSTDAIEKELRIYTKLLQNQNSLLSYEENQDFRTVEKTFKVIEEETCPTIVDAELAKQILAGKADWRALQKHSVSIRRNVLEKWHAKEIRKGLYYWPHSYDSFVGYMRSEEGE